MRFKEFLYEGTLEAVLPKYRKNMAILAERDINLYRGLKHRAVKDMEQHVKLDLGWIELESMKNRSSLSGHNFLMHLSKSWDTPDRSSSAFFTQSAKAAGQFGHPYVVVPRDDVKLYGYSKRDMNSASSEERGDAFNFFVSIHALGRAVFRVLDTVSNGVDTRTRDILVKKLHQHGLEKEFENGYSSKMDFEHFQPMLEFCDDIMSDKAIIAAMKVEEHIGAVNYLDDCMREIETSQHGKFADAPKLITAEMFGVKSYKSLADVPFDGTDDELWFEGHYLVLDAWHAISGKYLQKFLKAP